MKLLTILISVLIMTSCNKKDLSSHIGECFKFGKNGVILIEGILPENSGTSHDIGVLYYNKGDNPEFIRDTESYSYLSNKIICPSEIKNFKNKYDWNKYKLKIRTFGSLDVHNYQLSTYESYTRIFNKIIRHPIDKRLPSILSLIDGQDISLIQRRKLQRIYNIRNESFVYYNNIQM